MIRVGHSGASWPQAMPKILSSEQQEAADLLNRE